MLSFSRTIAAVPAREVRRHARPWPAWIGAASALTGQLLLLSLVTITAWRLGGVPARTQAWMLLGAAVVAACCLIHRSVVRTPAVTLPKVLFFLLGALILGAFQLLPLQNHALAVLSPRAAELRDRPMGAEPASANSLAAGSGGLAVAGRGPISLYPAATRRDLALLVLAVAIFFAGTVLFTTPRSQTWFCLAIAVNGGAYAFFELASALVFHSGTWRHEWYDPGHGSALADFIGPFFNRNHSGAFLNLCLAAAIALLIATAAASRDSEGKWDSGQTAPGGSFRLQLARWLQACTAERLAFFGLATCLVGGIICTHSRGAILSMIVAGGITVAVVVRTRRSTVWIASIGLAMLSGAALVAWLGMSDSVENRMATLLDRSLMQQTRIPHWRDAIRAIPDFWRTGSGLGSYAYVYPQYQQRLDRNRYVHAENHYLETFIVGGVGALLLLLAALGGIGVSIARVIRSTTDIRTYAFAIGACYAVTSLATHALCDFPLYIPAILVVIALWCGAISAVATRLPTDSPAGAARLTRWPAITAPLLAALLLATACWGSDELRRYAPVEKALGDTRPHAEPSREVAPAEYRTDLDRMAHAQRDYPDDAEAHYRMSQLWLGLYQSLTLEQLHRNKISASDEALWRQTSPLAFHGRAWVYARLGQTAALESLRTYPIVRYNLVPALEQAMLANQASPVLAGAHLLVAELGAVATAPSEDRIWIAWARRLAPASADVRLCCGTLEVQAGRLDAGCADWRKALDLDPKLCGKVLPLALRFLGLDRMVETVLPESPQRLVELARKQYGAPEQAEIRRKIARRADGLLNRAGLTDAETAYLRGSIAVLEEDYPRAIRNYRRAVTLRGTNLSWRYELALLLIRQGMVEAAREQAQVCAQLHPDNGDYRTLLEQIEHIRLAAHTD